MHFTIIGAGFAGLAVSQLLLSSGHSVHIIDKSPVGLGTSGISAGLLHPFGGGFAKLNREGREGMEASLQLLERAEEGFGSPVACKNGILRVAIDEKQIDLFKLSSSIHDDVEWWEDSVCQKKVPGLTKHPGIFIRSGVFVNTTRYLQGLWKFCEKLGATFELRDLRHWKEVKAPGTLIITTGASSITPVPYRPVKGQILEMEWPKGLPPLPFPINSHVYIVMGEDNQTCFVGATFEKDFSDEGVDIETAKQELMPKVELLLPPLTQAKIINCKTGIRATTKGRLPVIKQFDNNVWVYIGLGSKGLLYHALYAKKLLNLMEI